MKPMLNPSKVGCQQFTGTPLTLFNDAETGAADAQQEYRAALEKLLTINGINPDFPYVQGYIQNCRDRLAQADAEHNERPSTNSHSGTPWLMLLVIGTILILAIVIVIAHSVASRRRVIAVSLNDGGRTQRRHESSGDESDNREVVGVPSDHS
jgi:hypothetical protein